jgi:hypothetical protein
VKKCLNEVLKYGGPFSPRDLYPVGGLVSSQNQCNISLSCYSFGHQYQLALFQIDSLRKDGRFVGADGTIPEGQGIIMAHLNECHELVEMVSFIKTSNDMCSSRANQLKEAMDEGDEEDEEEDEEILTGQ